MMFISADPQEDDLTLKSPVTKLKYVSVDLYLEVSSQSSAKIG